MTQNNSMMNTPIISRRFLLSVPLIFIIVAALKIVYSFGLMKEAERTMILDESKVLSDFMMTHRNYYQNLFIHKNILLSQKTLPALPAFSAFEISEQFSRRNVQNIIVRTVSDRARNMKNKADKEELKAIQAFKNDVLLQEYYEYVENDVKNYYQYAIALRIEEKCLQCHGNKADAPQYIQKFYENAYDYKEGDIRGILSIKVPEGKLSDFFTATFWFLVGYDTLLLIGLFIFMQMLLGRLNKHTTALEKRVNVQHESLVQNVTALNGYKMAIDNSAMVSKGDLEGTVTYANEQFCKHTGYTQEELIGKNHNLIKDPELGNDFFEEMWNTILSRKIWKSIVSGRKKDNSVFYHDVTITPILDEHKNIKEYIAVRYDVTEVIVQRQEIKTLYATDALTRIPNRNKLLIDMQGIYVPQIALFNIDGFKNINDFYGIDAGDQLLIQFANYVKREIDRNQLFHFYRLHSDEFAVLGDSTLDMDEFVAVMHSYQKKTEHNVFSVSLEQEIRISVTLGLAVNKNALVKADMALKLAQNSKSEYIVYDDSLELDKQCEENVEKAKIIKDAIEKRNIIPYFQPIVELKTGQISKYEALVRMVYNDEVLSPGAFLHVAKQSRTYFKVTEIMIQEVFKQLHLTQSTLSVNLSIEDIVNNDMIDYIIHMLEHTPDASRIVFEILESENIQNYDVVTRFIREVKSFGVKIALDDFGSGYSNFAHILELEVDFLKIDGSLIKNIQEDHQSRILVEGIVDFSNRLGMQTIAEFVENEAIYEILKEIGVDYAQGYFIGKPSPEIV